MLEGGPPVRSATISARCARQCPHVLCGHDKQYLTDIEQHLLQRGGGRRNTAGQGSDATSDRLNREAEPERSVGEQASPQESAKASGRLALPPNPQCAPKYHSNARRAQVANASPSAREEGKYIG